MDPDFWHQRWHDNEIGFHQQEINLHLQRYWSRVDAPAHSPVFVPLCGKSLDMLWLLEQGHPVVGVEISALAVEAFFTENDIPMSRMERGPFTVYRHDALTLLCGDFFALEAGDVGECQAVYDRASLIALPPDMRRRYVEHMRRIRPPGTPTLLVTLDYPQHEMNGPPFAVSESEVRALYEPDWTVTALEGMDVLAENARFREKGLTALTENVYLLR